MNGDGAAAAGPATDGGGRRAEGDAGPWEGRVPDCVAGLYSRSAVADLVGLRRALHADPELSLREERTAARLEETLRGLGVSDVARVAGTGVVGRVPGRQPGAPPVAVRGDIDALPILEDTGLPFASRNEGVMHACGHDVHASWTVAAARLLQAEPADGDVVLVLQPAEETGEGAAAVLATGVLDEVAAIFGAHVDLTFEVGQAMVQEGAVGAAADRFEVELRGKGAHGARPHLGLDPIVGMAQVVTALQTVVSRRVPPDRPAVVTVGAVEAGTAHNVIPDRAVLKGTLRSLDPEVRRLLADEVRHVAESVAAACRLEARVRMLQGTPAVLNDGRAAAWAREAAASVVGAEAVKPLPAANMGGEDFAFYLERIPGCFIRVGARLPGDPVVGAHTPYFAPAEEAIFVGGALLAASARRASAALARN